MSTSNATTANALAPWIPPDELSSATDMATAMDTGDYVPEIAPRSQSMNVYNIQATQQVV